MSVDASSLTVSSELSNSSGSRGALRGEGMLGLARGRRRAIGQPAWRLSAVLCPLVGKTKPSSDQGLVPWGCPLCLYEGSCVRSITRETKIREENDKGREGEEYGGSSGSKCSRKIKAPNKNQQNGKEANRRSKAVEQNAGREVGAKELISHTSESPAPKQEISQAWHLTVEPAPHNGRYEEAGE